LYQALTENATLFFLAFSPKKFIVLAEFFPFDVQGIVGHRSVVYETRR
jgi:hypothetical protein